MPLSPFRRYRLRALIAGGGVIAYPTEAVYGLGCDPLNGEAVQRILAIKRRRWQQGLIVIAADIDQLRPFVELEHPGLSERVVASWPGPNTWLIPARRGVPQWLTGRHATLAVRVTDHPLAAALCRAFGGALVSTSANRAGAPPSRSALRTRLLMGGEVDAVVSGRCGERGRPSTIRDALTGETLRA